MCWWVFRFFLFFFKQKTAYEMRISDRSSDVCSSDLIEQHELITRGIGYLNRPKEVAPKNGDPFLSCSIGALAGPVEEPDYRYIDTIVATTDAQHLVRRCVEAVEAERKVLIAFRLNDMKTDPYIRTKGERAGEADLSLKSNLVHIGLIKVDGKQVYPTASQDRKSTRLNSSH